ncbi:MAG TPA: arginine deiminase family protein, partial [Phnomibacter sp.]|nr:arginine deiminase family protein [Phnomibacter sp.]
IHVTSEIGTLRRLLVHSPDSGLGKVVPSKAQDWLFEDIVHLDTIRRNEYDHYTKVLLYFLDPEKIAGKIEKVDAPAKKRAFYKPDNKEYFHSEKVVEIQTLLSDILKQPDIKLKLVASVCAIEGCPYETQMQLLQFPSGVLAKVFISGSIDEKTMIFPPIPNFIFTRDIGIVINDHILLNKPAKQARTREALLMKYIFFNHPYFDPVRDNVIELPDVHLHFLNPRDGEERKVTFEGGDVMVVSKDHLLIGVSERTSWEAAHQAIKVLFEKKVVKKITVVKIPRKRDYMHIDTVFTQVKRDTWVMLGNFSRKAILHEDADSVQKVLEGGASKGNGLKIIQFDRKNIDKPAYFDSLEELLTDISINDLGCKTAKFIFSGDNEFPYDAREQWTDSCNLLALKEGVVLGYDRNDKTIEAFRKAGFAVIAVKDLLDKFENGTSSPEALRDTFIMMPSAELSRARGGFHCMSMPLLRDDVV